MKEEKQDLLPIATYKVLSLAGFYELEGSDEQELPALEVDKKIAEL